MELTNKTLEEYTSTGLFTKYAVPSILGMLMGSASVFVDGFFVANFISADAFSAINVVWPIISLCYGFYVMFTIGAITFAGECIGKNNIKRTNLIFTQTLMSIFIISIILLSSLYCFRKSILPILGAHGEVYDLSLEYIDGALFAAFFWGFSYVFSQFIRLNGSPKFASYMFILYSLVNIILDPIFLVVFNFGITGAAWATVLGFLASFIMGISYFLHPNCRMRIIKIYGGWFYILKSASNGFAEFLSSVSAGIIPWLFNITAYQIAGNNGILIYSVANYAIMFFITLSYSVREALTPLVSVSYGAKNKNKMKDFLKTAIILISSISILVSCILLVKPIILVNALLKEIDKKTFEDVLFFVRASIPIFVCVGINIIMSAYYMAVQKSGASAIIAALRSAILPALLVLTIPYIYGFLGLVLVLPIVEMITLIVSISLYKNRRADIIIKD